MLINSEELKNELTAKINRNICQILYNEDEMHTDIITEGRLEAFPVDSGGSRFVVLTFPHPAGRSNT
ncbi:hypothetical protein NPIL_92551 [Nephila pilipes]|uniref:Uncharacterized protein n=1 Tax=Nephila pilipes TaxID=299642 RepID=A0A8X6PBY4_NEPPI|nr:hypothetical protein NPIL_92551 [Nephila pilipes]